MAITPSEVTSFAASALADEKLFCQMPDINIVAPYYGELNEGSPINVKPHLDKMEKGWIVSVGTERSFYDILLSPEERCEGVIIRDLDPRVKAYCDFLILLLRVATSREDFCVLSEMKASDLKPLIEERIASAQMSDLLKRYFLDNFDNLAKCYLGKCHDLPYRSDNTGVEYRKDDALFSKLQRYAQEGRIITVVGDINDLACTVGKKVSIIDASNVSDYFALHFQGYNKENAQDIPRIIHTIQHGIRATYCSGLYYPLPQETINEIDAYFSLFSQERRSMAVENFIGILSSFSACLPEQKNNMDTLPSGCYCAQSLEALKAAFKVLFSKYSRVSLVRSCLSTEGEQILDWAAQQPLRLEALKQYTLSRSVHDSANVSDLLKQHPIFSIPSTPSLLVAQQGSDMSLKKTRFLGS